MKIRTKDIVKSGIFEICIPLITTTEIDPAKIEILEPDFHQEDRRIQEKDTKLTNTITMYPRIDIRAKIHPTKMEGQCRYNV